MKNAILIYPISLFEKNDLLQIDGDVYLIEDPIYFTNYKFHKMKIILHRASMKFYFDFIKKHNPSYISLNQVNMFYDKIMNKYDNIYLHDVIDHPLRDKLHKLSKKYKSNLIIHDTPLFMETLDDLKQYKKKIKSTHYSHDHSFYRWQRRRLNILMNGNKPLFDKWSFDKENRQPYDDNYEMPKQPKINNIKYVIQAKKYVNKYFDDNFGEIDNFIYPVTFKQAKQLLHDFIKNKIDTFGKYQDAVSEKIIFGSHSLLSSSINIGLLTPDYVIDEVLSYFNKLSIVNKKKVINNVEGFIRQIIGWRSFTRFIYEYHGSQMMKMNQLNHKYKLNKKWFDGTTNIEPIDKLIDKVRRYAYLHHIERLMYIGNFCLLTKIHPMEVYKWFMIVSIDSYEWVMVSNVMGMSQYSLENISMMTRPYFSSSNYIKKMSDFDCDNWCDVWNALYYNFINDNYDMLKDNYSTAFIVSHWKSKNKQEKQDLINTAKKYLKWLDK